MEKRRPGAGQARYDDRLSNLLLSDSGMTPAVFLQPQAVDQEPDQVVTSGQSP